MARSTLTRCEMILDRVEMVVGLDLFQVFCGHLFIFFVQFPNWRLLEGYPIGNDMDCCLTAWSLFPGRLIMCPSCWTLTLVCFALKNCTLR